MSDETTREGVEEHEEATTPPVPVSKRQATIDAMVAKRRTEVTDESGDAGEPDPDGEDKGNGDDADRGEQDDLVTIKVDGKEQQVPRSQVYEFGIKSLQKEIAADARLAEASSMRRQLDTDRAMLQRREAEINAMAAQIEQQDQQSGSHPREGADDYREIAKAALQAIFDGEEDKAAEQLARLSQGRDHVTPEMLQQMATQASQQAKLELQNELRAEKWSAELGEAREWFEDKHKDIADDPEWRAIADRETADLMREHPDWFPKKVVEEAVKRVAKLRKSLPGTTDRRAIKQQIDSPRGASGRLPAPKEPTPQTRSEYIKELRRTRGLSV